MPIPAGATDAQRTQIAAMQQLIDQRVLPPSAVDQILHNRTSTIVLLSLSEKWDNLLMWAHYAAAHTGFVIGFEPVEEILRGESPHRHIAKVRYATERPSKFTFEEITNDELLLTKSTDWEYEQEWRIIDSKFSADGEASASAPDCWPFLFRPEAVKEVIVGYRASDEFIQKVEAVLDTDEDYAHVFRRRVFRGRKEYKLKMAHISTHEW